MKASDLHCNGRKRGKVMNAVETIQPKPQVGLNVPAVANGAMKDGNAAATEPWEWVKLRRMALHQADKFMSLLPLALNGGGNDAINKIRVTSRRLECLLSVLYPQPFPQHIQKFRNKLKAGRRRLGELRNYDALSLLVQQSLGHHPPGESEVWNAVRAYLTELKRENAPRILKDFCRINLASSYIKFRCGAESAQEQEGADGDSVRPCGPVEDILYERIMASLQQEWRKFEDTIEKSRHHPGERSVHSMRTAAKRLRYLMEVMKKLHIPGSAERLRWLRTLQDVVGRWHDLELLDHYMAEMISLPKFQLDYPHLGAKTEKTIARNRRIKAASERKFFWMTRKSHEYLQTREWMAEIMKSGAKQM